MLLFYLWLLIDASVFFLPESVHLELDPVIFLDRVQFEFLFYENWFMHTEFARLYFV